MVTDDFPPDHAHQHGLFFAWVNTTFDGRKVDFWNQHNRTGRVGNDPDDPGPTFNGGPIRAEFSAALRHDDLTAPGGPAPVLDETWAITAYDIPGVRRPRLHLRAEVRRGEAAEDQQVPLRRPGLPGEPPMARPVRQGGRPARPRRGPATSSS